jgi:mono/diheme cytochrome c family protein
LLAGLVAAGAAFGVVALATAGDGNGGGDGGRTAAPAGGEALHPGKAVFARMGCGSCHRLAAAGSSGAGFAPELDERLAGHTEESLREQILSPGELSMMPRDYRQRMSDQELDDLVDFLLASRPSD